MITFVRLNDDGIIIQSGTTDPDGFARMLAEYANVIAVPDAFIAVLGAKFVEMSEEPA
jgi:hypothetical protein